jgi:hypothetical protein
MNKKHFAVLTVVIMATAVMLSNGILETQANSYWCQTGCTPNPDTFCYCIHDGKYNYSNDTWVTLGMDAHYNTGNPYHYNWGNWTWDAGVGGGGAHDYWFYSAYDTAFLWYGYWSGGGFNTPGSPQRIGDRWYWDYSMPGSFADSSNMTGLASCWFIDNNSNMHYIGANPNAHGYSYGIFGAHAPPITNVSIEEG